VEKTLKDIKVNYNFEISAKTGAGVAELFNTAI
jgi:hypothetical protein